MKIIDGDTSGEDESEDPTTKSDEMEQDNGCNALLVSDGDAE